jgi:hypothetical protein
MYHSAEKPISIRIYSRDLGQHILVKQHLVCAGGGLFDFSGFRSMLVETHFLAAAVFFSLVFGLTLNNL